MLHYTTRNFHGHKQLLLVQVNYHGPYTLTRLLEPVLLTSRPSRIVNVASVEHRVGYIPDIKKFMFDGKRFLYSATKLGNVLFTYEHHRRLGALGIQVWLNVLFSDVPWCCRCVWLHSWLPGFHKSILTVCLILRHGVLLAGTQMKAHDSCCASG